MTTTSRTRTTNLRSRRFRAWALDAGERAVRTYAQATIAALPLADSGLSIEAFAQWEPHSVGLGAAALSLLMSLGAKRTGSPSSARLRG
jgi:hypothetical protein